MSGDILFWGFFLLAAIVLMIIFGLPRKKKKKAGSEKFTIRSIPALEEFATRQGYAIESGTRLHLSAGTADMNTQSAAATLLAVTNMEVLARNAAASDRPLVATTGDGVTALLLQSRLHAVYQRLGLSEDKMTKQQAIQVAQQSANKNKRPYAVVYDVSYAAVYCEADAINVATMGDHDTF